MTEDAEARRIVAAYCRAHDYTLIPRDHRKALAGVEAERDAALARVAELEAENAELRARPAWVPAPPGGDPYAW